MSKAGRPLSPHLTIYRWPISMTLSILHRITGVALSAGLVVLMIWLLALSFGATAFEPVVTLLGTIIGKLALVGFSFAFFFHFCNGIRHLFWDVGKGFEMRQVNASAWSVVVVSLSLTLLLWMSL